MGTAYAKRRKAGRQGSEAGKVGRTSLWAVGSLGGFEHERKAVARTPGWVCSPHPLGSSHPTLAKDPPSQVLGSKAWLQLSFHAEGGTVVSAEKHRACSQVPGQQA